MPDQRLATLSGGTDARPSKLKQPRLQLDPAAIKPVLSIILFVFWVEFNTIANCQTLLVVYQAFFMLVLVFGSAKIRPKKVWLVDQAGNKSNELGFYVYAY